MLRDPPTNFLFTNLLWRPKTHISTSIPKDHRLRLHQTIPYHSYKPFREVLQLLQPHRLVKHSLTTILIMALCTPHHSPPHATPRVISRHLPRRLSLLNL